MDEITHQPSVPERMRTFVSRHERHLSSAAFITGFLWDILTLTRVDSLYGNVVITAYLLLAFICIATYHASEAASSYIKAPIERMLPWLPIIMSFAFGGIFSGFLIFYWQSGTIAGSLPFLLILAGIFVGNEFLRERYARLTFQLAMLFTAIFSYSIYSVPILMHEIGRLVFLLSGLVSVFIFLAVLYVLYRVNTSRFSLAKRSIVGTTVAIFLAFNIAYFTNIIPPIPLALKELGVYHSVEPREGGAYALSFEPPSWYEFFEATDNVYNQYENEPVYAFSSVFAPTDLKTVILHRWSYYNPTEKAWRVQSEIAFPITGGRDAGYRGYSIKRNIVPGRWRVDVVTENGQLIGRKTFEVVASKYRPFKLTVLR